MVTSSATVSSIDDPDLDTTRLWHMWLGHISEGYDNPEQTGFAW
jgi:hypothetical protein